MLCDELKAYKPELVDTGFGGRQYAVMHQCANGAWYNKSEADRYIAYLKMKRCEKILENLSLGYNIECMKKYPTRGFFFEKWSRVFMRLAEHYKEIAK